MNTLERMSYLAATDPSFRQTLRADPEAAVAAHSQARDDGGGERGAVMRAASVALRSTAVCGMSSVVPLPRRTE